MNWEAAGAIGEILGAVVVFATLIYLARQIHHSVNQSRAAQNLSLFDSYADWNSQIMGNPELADLMVKLQDVPDSLSDREAVQARHVAFRYADILLAAEFAFGSGQITEEQLHTYHEDIGVMLRYYPGMRAPMIEILGQYPTIRKMAFWKHINDS